MNNSVASNAPKTKNFCGTISLKTRVGISGAVMALGYEEFWSRVFKELKLEMDSVFRSTLHSRDRKKNAKSKHFAVRFSILGGRFSVILEAPGAQFGHFGGPGGSFWRLGGSLGPPGPKFENSDQNRLEN